MDMQIEAAFRSLWKMFPHAETISVYPEYLATSPVDVEVEWTVHITFHCGEGIVTAEPDLLGAMAKAMAKDPAVKKPQAKPTLVKFAPRLMGATHPN